jgi:type IV secretion system protein VirD4
MPAPSQAAPLRASTGLQRSDFVGTAVLAAAGVVAAVVILYWFGAQLAAVASGHGTLPVPLGETAKALGRLPRHWLDPRAAWPPPARAALPGPVVYYACLSVPVVMTALVTRLGLHAWRATAPRRHPLGVTPHAGFARTRDLGPLAVPSPVPGRLTLGWVGRQLMACEARTSLAVIGPTGCGKTAGFAIPALLEWDGPVIATSVKTDLLAATIGHRRSRGTVWVYDPTASSGEVSCGWSPLASCRTWAGAMRTASWLAETAQARLGTVAESGYWYEQAAKGVAPYLYAAAISGRTMRDVVRWVDSQDESESAAALASAGRVAERVAAVLASAEGAARRAVAAEELRAEMTDAVRRHLADRPGGKAMAGRPASSWPKALRDEVEVRAAAEAERRVAAEVEAEVLARFGSAPELVPLIATKALWSKEPRLRGSVFATMENVLAGYVDPGVARAADRPSIDFAAWLAGDNTIYVVATSHEQARLRPVLTLLVQQAVRAAYDAALKDGGSLRRPCLVLLDEAGNIAPLRDLPGYAATARSHGITVVSVWQDLAQVKAIYHDRAQTVLNNHRAKLFGTGIADEATLEYLSRLIGDEAHREQSRSTDLTAGRRSLSEHTAYRRAAPVDVLRRIRPNEAVLVYGSELPAHVRLRPWFHDAGLRKQAGRPDLVGS